MKQLFVLFILLNGSLIMQSLYAQKRIVVVGSSTAAGTGASTPANSWAGKTQAHFRQNTTDGQDTILTNLAANGYHTYLVMPTGFIPPAGRPLPDPNRNITRALSYSPDIVIINLPSNDVTQGFTKKEAMNNFRLLFQTVTATGAYCYISTTQPRNIAAALRDSLRTLVDSINNNFGIYALDFWSDIVSTDGLFSIRPEVSFGDGIHINDIGHNLLFLRVRNKNIFAPNIPLPVRLTVFTAVFENNAVSLNWRAEAEEALSYYELQRAGGNAAFRTLYTRTAAGTGITTDYSWKDTDPLPGKSFYRLKIIEPNKTFYSAIVSVTFKPRYVDIRKLYLDQAGATLLIDISVKKDQAVLMEIINTTGVIVYQQKQQVNMPSARISIPVAGLAGGQYFFRLRDFENNIITQAFLR